MARKILLDTETTGGSVRGGDRIIEIGMVETLDFVPTGRVYHAYMDPEHPIHWGATRVHKLTNKMLAGYPLFADHAEEIADFLQGAELYAHNATFDHGFVTSELMRAGYEPPERSAWTCTIPMARKALGVGKTGKASLDHVVQSLGITVPNRKVHGALLDAAILAKVAARISGAPDVDIEALVAQSKPFPGTPGVRAPAGRGTGQKKPALIPAKPVRDAAGPVSPKKSDGSPTVKSSAPSQAASAPKPEQKALPAHVLEDGLSWARKITDHATQAKDLMDFLQRCEADGLNVRPNVSNNGKELMGFRFTADTVQLLGSSMRLKGDVFRKGHLAYIPQAHSEAIVKRRNEYDAGPDRSHVPTLLRMDLKTGMAVTRNGQKALLKESASQPARQEKPHQEVVETFDPFSAIVISSEVATNITSLNETTPSVRPLLYKDLKSGQDGWSKLSGAGLMQAAESCADPGSRAMQIISDLPEKTRDAALRWVCRGLDAGHALAKTASDGIFYERPLDDDVMKDVEALFDTAADEFDMDMC